jgi:hypothetical protein
MESLIFGGMPEEWRIYLDSLFASLALLEKDVTVATQMSGICVGEWCTATGQMLDDISNSASAISEPDWLAPEDSKRLKALRKRIHRLYAGHAKAIGLKE